MQKVFVTGASGFVGLQLVTRLKSEGISVRCLVRKSSRRAALEELGVEFIEGDVRDIDALRRGIDGTDTVFHIAGVISANTPEHRPGDQRIQRAETHARFGLVTGGRRRRKETPESRTFRRGEIPLSG